MTRQAPKTLSSLGLLNQNPNSFNDILTVFEAYLETLLDPLGEIVTMVNSLGDFDRAEITIRLLSHSNDASAMAKKLQDLRATHNAGTDVTVTLTDEETRRIEEATQEVPYLLGWAESIFGLLADGATGGFLDGEHRLPALFEICARGFKAAAANEGEAVAMFDQKLRSAMGDKARAEYARNLAEQRKENVQ